MKETLRHKTAFEFYYKLGDKRSLRSVGRKFKVSEQSVGKWSKNFNWQERVQIRDQDNAKSLEKKTNTSIVSEKANLLNILKRTIYDAVKKIKVGKLGIEDQMELLKTIELALRLMGDSPGIDINIPVPELISLVKEGLKKIRK